MNKKSLRTLDDFAHSHLIDDNDLPQLAKVAENFSLTISQQMYQQIDKTNANDPIAKQFVPSVKELDFASDELSDPIGEEIHTPVRGIVHRHRDRCLFIPVYTCAVYCRFCFRREKIASTQEALTKIELDKAFAYIKEHSEIWEVILTGGDPLILKPRSLIKLLTRLSEIDHVEVIRIHTRVPVVASQRIDAELIAALKCKKPVYLILHANHPKEFTAEAIKACALLVDAGIPMLSQTILLKDINDNIDVLSTLMRCFIKNRIKPYYLHHGDLVRGTKHFRTTIATGQRLVKELRERFSGICQPTYVLDIPGGYGKIPIGPQYIYAKETRDEEEHYAVIDYHGNAHDYPPSHR